MDTVLEVSELTKCYDRKVKALDKLSFSLKKGDFLGVFGRNGAGKTTLFSILSTLNNPTSGYVKLCGKLYTEDINFIRKRIGVVPQYFNCSSFDRVLDVLIDKAGYYGIPRNISEKIAKDYLNRFGLQQYENNRVYTLSEGNKRKLLIARALINDPILLILDEPTNGVDIDFLPIIWSTLKEVSSRGTTILLTSHNLMEMQELASSVMTIKKGHITSIDSTDKFVERMKNTYILFLSKGLPKINLDFDMEYILDDVVSVTLEGSKTLEDFEKMVKSFGCDIKKIEYNQYGNRQ